jgi:hypothetical protein
MSSLAVSAPAVNTAATFDPMSIPYIWGAQDARCGLVCVPEMVWVQLRDQREYAAGWASVKGHNDTTRLFLGSVN